MKPGRMIEITFSIKSVHMKIFLIILRIREAILINLFCNVRVYQVLFGVCMFGIKLFILYLVFFGPLTLIFIYIVSNSSKLNKVTNIKVLQLQKLVEFR